MEERIEQYIIRHYCKKFMKMSSRVLSEVSNILECQETEGWISLYDMSKLVVEAGFQLPS